MRPIPSGMKWHYNEINIGEKIQKENKADECGLDWARAALPLSSTDLKEILWVEGNYVRLIRLAYGTGRWVESGSLFSIDR
jgi:hypothetical protein